MTARPRRRATASPVSAKSAPWRWKRWLPVCVLLALVPILCQRTLQWPFLWDDFDFLGRALGLRLGDLLPRSDVIFYRPISREIYFWLITRTFGANPVFAHVANALLAVGVVLLAAALSRRILDARAGFITGALTACGAALPLATGWISGAQDLLCALFFLLACHLQLSRRPLASAAMMGMALLSKETALALLPVPIVIPILLGRTRREAVTTALAMTAVLAAWVLIHPWPRGVWGGTITSNSAGAEYVGLRLDTALGRWVHALLATLHLHWPGAGPRWTGENLLPGALALVAIWSGMWAIPDPKVADAPRGRRLAFVMGAIIVLGTTTLTALTIRIWSPYYALIPSLGVSLAGGALLGDLPRRTVAAVLASFLSLGVLLRDAPADPTISNELNFAETARALNRVERGFKELHPVMPRSASVHVSVQLRGHGSLYLHLFRFQPLRVWYRDESLWILDPNRRRTTAGPDLLFWIDEELTVYEIDLATLEPIGPSHEVPIGPYQKTLRGYATGLASTGMTDRAVEILTTMLQVDDHVRNLDRRLAAMLLYATGRSAEARALVSTLPGLERDVSVGSAAEVLVEPVHGLDLDLAAMQAFEVRPDDVPALRAMMLRLEGRGAALAAARFAQRIQSLDPADTASARVLGNVNRAKAREITPPVPHDLPQ